MDAEPLVLLVDDDRNALDGFVELLESEGFRVVVAGSADEALARCQERTPDVIVTDIALPDRDGFELAADLRVHPDLRDAPIVAMTAYWATDVHQRAASAGISAVLAKPCQPDHLIAELRRAISKSTAVRRV